MTILSDEVDRENAIAENKQIDKLSQFLSSLLVDVSDEQEDWSQTSRLLRISFNSESTSNLGEHWVIGDTYAKNSSQDSERQKKEDFSKYFSWLIESDQIIEIRVGDLENAKNMEQDEIIYMQLNILLKSGGILLMQIANSTKIIGQENVKYHLYGSKSSQLKKGNFKDQTYREQNYPIVVTIPKIQTAVQ